MNLYIASFDIGRKNFAQYVEKTSVEHILSLQKRYNALPKKYQRRVKGPMNEYIQQILSDIPLFTEVLEMDTYSISPSEEKDPPWDMTARIALFSHLEKFTSLWDKCHIFVIEQQYFSTFTPKGRKTKGTEANVKAIKIAEDVLSWFLIRYPAREVIYFGSQYKTQMFGAPNSLTKPQRKKWSIQKTLDDFERLNKKKELEHLFKRKKQKQKLDDTCDAYIQCQAYKLRELIAEF